MIRRALSHLDLTITDPDRSIPFYDAVLLLLGYRRVPVEPDTTAVACWSIADAAQSVFSIALERARGTGKRRKYNRQAPGLHHSHSRVPASSQLPHTINPMPVSTPSQRPAGSVFSSSTKTARPIIQ